MSDSDYMPREMSDQLGEGKPNMAHLVNGVDYCNDLKQKVVNGNTALDKEAGCTVSVACIEAKIERRQQMEEPPSVANHKREGPVKRVQTQDLLVVQRKADPRPAENDVLVAIKVVELWNVRRRVQRQGNVLREEYSDDDQGCVARRRIDHGVRNTRVGCGARTSVCLGL